MNNKLIFLYFSAALVIYLPPQDLISQQKTEIKPLEDTADISFTWKGSGSWEISDDKLVLIKAGVPEGPIRKPAAIALLGDHYFEDFEIEVEVRSTSDTGNIHADVLLIFGYKSPIQFYYVHLSRITDGVHNGIFLVNNTDRKRINEVEGMPVLPDNEWHKVRLIRNVSTGAIEVFADGTEKPVMRTVDKTFTSGKVGFGSFDDTGEFRKIEVTGVVKQP